MNFKVNFSEQSEGFSTGFGEVQNVGTIDHELLTNRCIPDQHCIAAITGLEDALAEKLPASSFVFGTTDGTVYEGSAGAKNAEDIAFVKQVLIETGTITKIEVEQAYTSRVTADGQNIVDGQKTPVTMIKGSTKRCENLLVYPYSTTSNTTNNGITWTFDEQGVITVNGTSTAISAYYLINNKTGLNKAGTYTISMVNGSSSYYLETEARDIATGKWFWGVPVRGGSYTFTLNEGEYFVAQIRVASGVTANNQKIYVMLNEGSTALPWQPYFTGLKHAKIDSIVSTGRNLLNRAQRIDGIAATGQPIFAHATYSTFYFHAPFNTNVTLSCGNNSDKIYVSLSNSLEVGTLPVGNTGVNRNKSVSINTQQYKYVLVSYWTADGNAKPDEVEIWANVGTTATEYTPFIQETYQLPETLELPEWDRFNPQTGEITRATSEQLILTGDENWGARGTRTEAGDTLYRNYISLSSIAPTNIKALQAVSNLYNGVTAENTYYRVTGVSASDKYIDVYDPDFATNDISLWKQHLKDLYAAGTPLIVEYKLATPTVEKLEYAPKSYTAYNQGNETAVLENEEFGAIPTITNEYFKVKV